MGSNDFQLSYCIRKAFAKLRQLTIMNRVKVPGNTFEAFYLKTLFELFFLLNIIQWALVRLFRNVVFILFILHDQMLTLIIVLQRTDHGLLVVHQNPSFGPWFFLLQQVNAVCYLLNKYDQKWSHVSLMVRNLIKLGISAISW